MYLIAGLGNPGKKYEHTRHNVGFDVIDLLSERCAIPVKTKKFKALSGVGTIGDEKVILLQPQTYMNLSGEAIRAAAEYYGIEPDHVIVICDDIHLELGTLRLRPSGSAGGHHGLENIILELASDGFVRCRIGVGLQPETIDRITFVLSHFTKDERAVLDEVYDRTAKAVAKIMESGIQAAGNLYNGKRI